MQYQQLLIIFAFIGIETEKIVGIDLSAESSEKFAETKINNDDFKFSNRFDEEGFNKEPNGVSIILQNRQTIDTNGGDEDGIWLDEKTSMDQELSNDTPPGRQIVMDEALWKLQEIGSLLTHTLQTQLATRHCH
ncbi:uncharacterized protein LOC106094143 isoform X3 [Stomoxys calcitrans]|uniref:uncharacterized protein LOC106094143 isoform X3 n=1 Tax=Stomoxys calcitrans TaxID=35570 RepID=UPI0027E242BF|nr:uncharacterized protein LOC106094143 isoform X3 [Stomoxys calcitrans]